jgi:hypothetical protein
MVAEQGKQPKRVLCARVSETGYAHVQRLADEQDVSVSHMTRRLLLFAVEHMPKDWKPKKERPDDTRRGTRRA